MADVPLTPRRALVVVAFCVLFPVVELWVWAGLLADEVFFRGYRARRVKAPVFIVGNFRSGTTFLHRLLAQDTGQFCTMKMWEILFAPSVISRRVVGMIDRLQRLAGKVLGRWVAKIEAGWARKNVTHKVSLNEPEEDDYLLMHIFSTLTVGLASGLTRLAAPFAHFDQQIPAEERRRIMDFYLACVQRHLHAVNDGLHYLAKNPALTPKLGSVFETFPDAKVIVLVRDAAETLASTASMMQITWSAVGAGGIDDPRREFLLSTAAHWYRYPRVIAKDAKEVVFVKYENLVANPEKTVREIYERLGFVVTEEFARILAVETSKARGYSSRHSHSLAAAGIDEKRVAEEFTGLAGRG